MTALSSRDLRRFFIAAPEHGLGLAAGLQRGDFMPVGVVPEQQLPGGLVVLSRVEIGEQRRRGKPAPAQIETEVDQRIELALGERHLDPVSYTHLCPAVESVPGKVSGAWVLKGTRMPVSAIFENIAAGANIDDIMEWFDGLDREQVKAVIEFAARSLDKVPVYAP